MSALATTSPLVDEHEAARILGLKVATLRRWRWCCKGPQHIKLGPTRHSAVRYEIAALEEFIVAGRRTSTSDRGAEVARA